VECFVFLRGRDEVGRAVVVDVKGHIARHLAACEVATQIEVFAARLRSAAGRLLRLQIDEFLLAQWSPDVAGGIC
jgi:hypothetical protein